jgi:hypothetical protein
MPIETLHGQSDGFKPTYLLGSILAVGLRWFSLPVGPVLLERGR